MFKEDFWFWFLHTCAAICYDFWLLKISGQNYMPWVPGPEKKPFEFAPLSSFLIWRCQEMAFIFYQHYIFFYSEPFWVNIKVICEFVYFDRRSQVKWVSQNYRKNKHHWIIWNCLWSSANAPRFQGDPKVMQAQICWWCKPNFDQKIWMCSIYTFYVIAEKLKLLIKL